MCGYADASDKVKKQVSRVVKAILLCDSHKLFVVIEHFEEVT